jgi:hypothetical protein
MDCCFSIVLRHHNKVMTNGAMMCKQLWDVLAGHYTVVSEQFLQPL